MARHPGFPFTPKTVAHVRAGDFWGIPLLRGGWYCCGRVLCTDPGLNNRQLTVGLLGWCAPEKPTSDAIARAKVLRHGIEHVRVIGGHGGLLGRRPLESDGGLEYLLPGRPVTGPDVSVWSDSISDYAHDLFGRHFPESPAKATELPTGIAAREGR